ncbi:MAG: membrane associated rhomboid family serine protease [Planctomycetota bacterium]|jgi:membrane associated rhomboid family serine protease
MQLDYDTAWESEPWDAWATITLIVCSTILSLQSFQGADYDFLVPDWRTMPQASWTFATSTLLHAGWLHLAFNVYWTLKFGVLLEAMLGTVLFTLTVIALAIGSSAAQWAWSGPGIGLSGIGYGLFGLLWALDRQHPKCRGILDKKIAELFAAWFLLCLLLTWYDVMPIANIAHGMGFVIGANLGWFLSSSGKTRSLSLVSLLAVTGLIAGSLLAPVRSVLNRSDAYGHELFERGYDALGAKDWKLAQGYYVDLVARDPKIPEAWHNLAIALRRLGLQQESEEAFERSVELKDSAKPAERPASSDGSMDLLEMPFR